MSASSIITSIVTGGSNPHSTVSEEANNVATDFISQGVVGNTTNTAGNAPSTGAFAVNADTVPDMGVTISPGHAYIAATPSGQDAQVLQARMATSYTGYVINPNSSGATKYDWIYLSVSVANAANPSAAADNVTTLYTSRSTSNSSDTGTPPAYGVLLAVVTVVNGAPNITNGSVADKRTISNINFNYRNNNGTLLGEVGAKEQSGWVCGQPGVANSITFTVTFPTGYSLTPIVNATFVGDTTGITSALAGAGFNVKKAACMATSIGLNQFLIIVYTTDNTNWASGNTVYATWTTKGL